jgi:5-methyltetrahydrofolate--homocysteine methyltransferase
MKFIELLKSNKTIFADGAQGTEFQRLKGGHIENPNTLNFTDPQLIAEVAQSYAKAGSDFVCANTFNINRFNVADVDAEIKQALTVTKNALKDTGVLTALDVTTLGQLLEPSGTLTFEEAYDIYKEIFISGEKHGADLAIIETMTDLYETKAALLALKENTSLPVICSLTFEQNGRTFTGTPVACMAATLEGLGADVLGINCSLGPVELAPLVHELLSCTTLPVMVKPNAGLPDPVTGKFPMKAPEFAEAMAKFSGVRIMGGCCGTTPEFIKRLRDNVGRDALGTPWIFDAPWASHPTVCGATTAVDITRPRIIGERINPTGKKLMKQALLDHDMGYILKQAAEQVAASGDGYAGADILDINVGAAGIDEVIMLPKVVKAVQGITGVPLQLDSANPAALEAALRVTNGKPIVNSVNAEPESLEAILPLVKKYGAAVVGLTLDKAGIPKTAEERLILAEKILARATELGIRREDIFIDCLTLTVGAEQEGAAETLKAVRLVKEKLGLKTVLGVSNISFGLPERGIINRTFLANALQSGLDMPIMNPNEKEMRDTVRAFNVLAGYDKNANEYIQSVGRDAPGAPTNDASGAPTNTDTPETACRGRHALQNAIQNGLKTEAVEITKQLLENTEPLEIINTQLIPALDKVGALFESGKIFLPQLMLSAESASACFEVIKTRVGRDAPGAPSDDKKILLATVKGDIHDIGKNIVRTLLESYGYNVIDLGRDVDSSVILEEVKRQRIKLVGLSALMTPTLPAMEETAKLVKTANGCKVMVGGAVVTEDWALKTAGADFYGKDAKSAVDIAAKVFD